MAQSISIPLSDFDVQLLEKLKANNDPSARIMIRVVDEKEEEFSETDFWKLIGLLDWEAAGNDIIKPVVEELANQPIGNIYLFADYLADTLFQLDTAEHGAIYEAEFSRISVDDFLYVRAAVVANGKPFYESVIDNPKELPVDVTFELLLEIAGKAYQQKTQEDLIYAGRLSYETYSNKQAWKRPAA